jgi:thiol-disulfide isomerase/thioredoxin
MNNIFCILILLVAQVGMAQQLVLTGSVTPVKPVELNDTYDGNYWKKNASFVTTNAAGKFKKSITSATPRWMWLGDDAHRQRVLLSPGRPLHVTLKNDKPTFRGTGAPENNLIATLLLETTSHLPFIKALRATPSYANAPIDSIIRFTLPQVFTSMDSLQQHVHRAGLPGDVEKTIQTEVKYYYANAIANDMVSWLNRGANRRDFHLYFIDAIEAHFPVPIQAELDVSPAANIYLEQLFRLRVWKVVFAYRTDPDKAHADSVFLNTLGVPYNTVLADAEHINEKMLFHNHMKALMPVYAWERSLNNELYGYCMSGQLQDAARRLQFIQRNTHDVQLVRTAEAMYAPLKNARDQYASNLDIKIRQDYKDIGSAESLLAPYKGKVVFIDMWGTWCPYCISDMAYEPALKKQLDGKDVVFLYLAQDTDKDDEKWRDFIFANNVTGEHVRKTADDMNMLWNGFGIPDRDWKFPYYMIVDRTGKIVVRDAKRPTETDALYQQLLAVVEQR